MARKYVIGLDFGTESGRALLVVMVMSALVPVARAARFGKGWS